jgi:hypothetical protein
MEYEARDFIDDHAAEKSITDQQTVEEQAMRFVEGAKCLYAGLPEPIGLELIKG